MVIYATELHLFQATQAISLAEMLKRLDFDAFDLWRTYEAFMGFDLTMPRKVREHFVNLEKQIVQYLSWQPGSNVTKKINEILNPKALEGTRTLEE